MRAEARGLMGMEAVAFFALWAYLLLVLEGRWKRGAASHSICLVLYVAQVGRPQESEESLAKKKKQKSLMISEANLLKLGKCLTLFLKNLSTVLN